MFPGIQGDLPPRLASYCGYHMTMQVNNHNINTVRNLSFTTVLVVVVEVVVVVVGVVVVVVLVVVRVVVAAATAVFTT
jgi:hypothetical protein